MIAETTNDISVATVTATSESSPQPPRAMAETAFWATHFWSTWWLLHFVASWRIGGGRYFLSFAFIRSPSVPIPALGPRVPCW